MDEIDERIRKQLKSSRVQTSSSGTASGQPPGGETLAAFSRLLGLKADKEDAERLHELKANKIDVENLLDIQGIMTK